MKRETKLAKLVNLQMQSYTDKEIIQDLKISRRTYFYWKGRIEKEGLASVSIKQKPGPRTRTEIDKNIRKKILGWRDKYGWGPT
ncbi:MAG: hypothetical protein QMD85_04070, partial [Candidatus Aenigmarchaeota archaeon]|nr:hypothetical protein [Candidatus Aenigmarchaeota archaeon]MDI6722738.1 hypothetical protein [Candidatus Aenigmarchaeota archaeon]